MSNNRVDIRRALKATILAAEIGVKNISFTRPHEYLDTELPAILIYYAGEDIEPLTGANENVPIKYNRKLAINIDILCTFQRSTNGNTIDDDVTDDWLDTKAKIIEAAIASNWTLNDLTNGSKLQQTVPFNLTTVAEKVYYGSRMRFIFPYETNNFPQKKFVEFKSFSMKIFKENYVETTIDPVLKEAEKTIN